MRRALAALTPNHMKPDGFRFECPACEQHISAPYDTVGMTGSCPTCFASFTVPAPESLAAVAAVPQRFSKPTRVSRKVVVVSGSILALIVIAVAAWRLTFAPRDRGNRGDNTAFDPDSAILVKEDAAPWESAPAFRALDPREVFKRTSASVAVIKTFDAASRPTGFGSGFFVDDGFKVATNFHVIEGASKVEITFADGTTCVASDALSYSRAHDLAILPVSSRGEALPLSAQKADVGERVFAIGNPMGLNRTLSEGLISGVRAVDGVTLYQMTAPISPGSSGGPVVNASGQVLGISTFTFRDSQNLNFAVPSTHIQELLFRPAKVSLAAIRLAEKQPVALGKGALEIVKVNFGGVSIKNKSANAMEAVLVRFLYFEPSKKAKEQESLASQIKRLESELAIIREVYGPSLKSAQRDIETYKAYLAQDLARGDAGVSGWRSNLRRAEDRYEEENARLDKAKAKLAEANTNFDRVRSQGDQPPTLVHYQDETFIGTIAPGLTRYFEFRSNLRISFGCTIEALLLDHTLEEARKTIRVIGLGE